MEQTTELDPNSTPSESENLVTSFMGVKIEGLNHLEESGIASFKEVQALLSLLPDNYFKITQVDRIIFETEKYFTVEREGNVVLVKESEIEPNDKKLRRARGITEFDHEMVDGKMIATTGRQTIRIFSTKDWEGEDDKDVTLYTLAHELGHATWNAIETGPRIWEGLKEQGTISGPMPEMGALKNVISAWRKLPESQLERFQWYQPHVVKEFNREGDGLE